MNIQRITLSLLMTGFLLSCSSEDDQHPGDNTHKGNAPLITASAVNGTTTKAGVKEDNLDYVSGELFRWMTGDKTTVQFINADTNETIDYIAEKIDEANPKKCTFTPDPEANVDNGIYSVYGFYPAGKWGPNGSVIDMTNQAQADTTSNHLADYFFQKAEAANVVVEGYSNISLQYEHLVSLIRYSIWDATEYEDGDTKLTLKRITLSSTGSHFGTEAKLEKVDTTKLTVDPTKKTDKLTLNIADVEFFEEAGRSVFHGYQALLPTNPIKDDLTISLEFTNGESTELTLSEKDLNFLKGGFQQGYSYYFRIKVDMQEVGLTATITDWDDRKTEEISSDRFYLVGDYYPDPYVVYENKVVVSGTPAIGVVFWIDPASGGTHGKVVSLQENDRVKWKTSLTATDISESSMTNGVSNMAVVKAKDEDFSEHPAFEWVHKLNEGKNPTYSSDEKEVWYLPAKNELKCLYAGYSGKVYEDISKKWGSLEAMPGNDSEDAQTVRAAFDEKLSSAAGGTGFGSNWYWSSTKTNTNCYAWVVDFDYGAQNGENESNPLKVRCILAF